MNTIWKTTLTLKLTNFQIKVLMKTKGWKKWKSNRFYWSRCEKSKERNDGYFMNEGKIYCLNVTCEDLRERKSCFKNLSKRKKSLKTQNEDNERSYQKLQILFWSMKWMKNSCCWSKNQTISMFQFYKSMIVFSPENKNLYNLRRN